jgi:hypothetical protein
LKQPFNIFSLTNPIFLLLEQAPTLLTKITTLGVTGAGDKPPITVPEEISQQQLSISFVGKCRFFFNFHPSSEISSTEIRPAKYGNRCSLIYRETADFTPFLSK